VQGVPGKLDATTYPTIGVYPSLTESKWFKDILTEKENSDVIGFSWYTYAYEYLTGSASTADQRFSLGARSAPADVLSFLRSWGQEIGDLPDLGPVQVEGSVFDNPDGSRTWEQLMNTAVLVRDGVSASSTFYIGDDAYNISGIALSSCGGDVPAGLTVKLYKLPMDNNAAAFLPTEGTLVVSKTFTNPIFNTDQSFSRLDFDAPISVQADAKYVMTLSSTGGDWWVLGRRTAESYGIQPPATPVNIAYSTDGGSTWTPGYHADNVYYPVTDGRILYTTYMRDDYNPLMNVYNRYDSSEGYLLWSLGAVNGSSIAQGFIPTVNNITGFAFGGSVNGNSLVMNGGHIYARLYDADEDSKPIGSPLASVEVSSKDLGGYPRFNFGTPVRVTAGNRYVATLEVSSEVTGVWLVSFCRLNPNSDGQALISTDQGASWTTINGSLGADDWKFRTFYDLNTNLHPLAGDANDDNAVDVGDLGILAANYGKTSGAIWSQGDFNDDGAVDVGDLGILAANYGTGSGSANFDANYAKVFGTTTQSDEDTDETTVEDTSRSACSGLGLSLIAGLFLAGLMLIKLEE
jgi:hypothetical protein